MMSPMLVQRLATVLYRGLARPVLFRVDAERAHELAIAALKMASRSPALCRGLEQGLRVKSKRLEIEAFGLRFPNPVGLAAGFDKNAVAVPALQALGFGHLEVGTVTPLPQSGNPRPRLVRLTQDRGLINSLGFPNVGMEAFGRNLKAFEPANGIIGINLGKGRDTPIELAVDDYLTALERLYLLADFVVINVSSPNTVGLRQLQARELLEELLRRVQARSRELAARPGSDGRKRPVLVKVAPDLTWAELDDVLAAVEAAAIDGLIATNTTIKREGVTSPNRDCPGGVSGAPLRELSTEIVRYVYRHTEGRLPIIGVGGVFTARDALEKIRAGARLVQLYTGMIYQGPTIAWQINREIDEILRMVGVERLEEIVGVAVKG